MSKAPAPTLVFLVRHGQTPTTGRLLPGHGQEADDLMDHLRVPEDASVAEPLGAHQPRTR